MSTKTFVSRNTLLVEPINILLQTKYYKSGNKCVCVISASFASHTIRTYFKTPKIHTFSSIFRNGEKRKNKKYQKSTNEKNAKFYDALNTRFTVVFAFPLVKYILLYILGCS